ncbi:hypothetical protein GCM10009864_23390 [Streptomyces lunalinharesii]|uniref:Transposase n=1 Tax=Streptomyces lunalinharesii TaxID=333384 RepID=A0ABP6E268_9ACTN
MGSSSFSSFGTLIHGSPCRVVTFTPPDEPSAGLGREPAEAVRHPLLQIRDELRRVQRLAHIMVRCLVRLKGLDYPLCASSSVASVCWVAAHDARSARLSAVGVPAGAV